MDADELAYRVEGEIKRLENEIEYLRSIDDTDFKRKLVSLIQEIVKKQTGK